MLVHQGVSFWIGGFPVKQTRMKRVIKLAPNNGDFTKQPWKIAKENASAVKTVQAVLEEWDMSQHGLEKDSNYRDTAKSDKTNH